MDETHANSVTTEETVVSFRIPKKLKEAMARRMVGVYSSSSEYLRDLIRKDIERGKEAQA